MAKFKHAIAALAVYLVTTSAVIFKPQNEFKALSAENTSFAVDLQPWFNNRAFGLKPNDSSFDGKGSGWPLS
jgi:alpha-L-fucosidase